LLSKSSLMVTVLFILAIIGAFNVYKPFLLPIVVAMLLTMATFNLTKTLVHYTNSAKISAGISTTLLSLLLFAPIVYIATIGVGYVSEFDNAGVKETFTTVKIFAGDIPFLKGATEEYLADEKINSYIQYLTQYITVAGSAGIGFVKDMFLVVIFYFFINYYGSSFFDTILELLPVSPKKGEKMIEEVSSTMEIVFYSIIVTAIFEGFLFGVIMQIFDFNGLLFGVIYGFASLIPIIGGVIVWAPVSLYVWTKIDSASAITIATYSIVMISVIADTFIKPMIIEMIKVDFLKSVVKINTIVIFFSILAGMSTYGFWGMILGPAVTSFLIAITKVYIDNTD